MQYFFIFQDRFFLLNFLVFHLIVKYVAFQIQIQIQINIKFKIGEER